jgi:ATPase subunit of ABC transporter with duplicated ATPase domains
MPAALVARQLTVTRGPRTILADVDVHLAPGRRAGVIGPNGVGKSSLLRVFADLSIDDRLRAQHTATLSGGEAARVPLASLLLTRFDVMLLDEPTNDLDLDGLDRFERWMIGLDVPVVLVSHDRAFLERTITDVIEIDHHSHRAAWFAGGWSACRAERELAQQRARERFDQYDTQRQSLLDRRQREREWAAKGAGRARRSGERDKYIRHHQLNQTEQLAGRSAQTDRALERLEAVEEPRTPWELRYDIPTVARSGDVVATANGAVVERGAFRPGRLISTSPGENGWRSSA